MEDIAALVIRLAVGAIFIAHGLPKVSSDVERRHGRAGPTRTLTKYHFPKPQLLAWAVGVSEVVGGALMLIGLFTRFAAVPPALIVAGAIFLVKWRRGFVDGWDWPLSVLAGCITLMLLGGGSYSVDAFLGF